MFELIKKTIFIGAGLAAMTAEKIEAAVAEIVKKGEISEKEGKELVADLIEKSKETRLELGAKIEKMISDTLQRLHIPTQKDLEELKARIERLEKDQKRD